MEFTNKKWKEAFSHCMVINLKEYKDTVQYVKTIYSSKHIPETYDPASLLKLDHDLSQSERFSEYLYHLVKSQKDLMSLTNDMELVKMSLQIVIDFLKSDYHGIVVYLNNMPNISYGSNPWHLEFETLQKISSFIQSILPKIKFIDNVGPIMDGIALYIPFDIMAIDDVYQALALTDLEALDSKTLNKLTHTVHYYALSEEFIQKDIYRFDEFLVWVSEKVKSVNGTIPRINLTKFLKQALRRNHTKFPEQVFVSVTEEIGDIWPQVMELAYMLGLSRQSGMVYPPFALMRKFLGQYIESVSSDPMDNKIVACVYPELTGRQIARNAKELLHTLEYKRVNKFNTKKGESL